MVPPHLAAMGMYGPPNMFNSYFGNMADQKYLHPFMTPYGMPQKSPSPPASSSANKKIVNNTIVENKIQRPTELIDKDKNFAFLHNVHFPELAQRVKTEPPPKSRSKKGDKKGDTSGPTKKELIRSKSAKKLIKETMTTETKNTPEESPNNKKR